MMSQNNNIPQIRFKGFNDVWEQCKLGDVVSLRGRIGFRGYTREDLVPAHEGAVTFSPSDIDEEGHLSLENNDYISFEKYEESPEIKVKVGDILFTKTASIGKTAYVSELLEKSTINPQFALLTPNEKINRYYLFLSLRLDNFMQKVWGITGGSSIPTMSQEKLKELYFDAPNLVEQEQISKLFMKLDNLITLHQRKHEKYTNLKKALLEKMFPKNGEKIPQIRFKGFTEAWEQCKYEELGINHSGGSLSYDDLKDDGKNKCVLYGELYTRYDYIIKNVINQTNEQGLTIYKNDILFPQSTTVDAYSLISPACFNDEIAETSGVFVIRPYDFVNGNFIAYYTKGNSHQRLKLSKKAQGLTIVHLYYQSIKDETIHVPNIDEQNKIACLFIQLDNLITLHQREYEKLKNIKKSLLEKMFV